MGFEKDRIPEGQFLASDLHGIDADIPFTALVDHTAHDDRTALDDHTALDYHMASDDLNDSYDSELEIIETQFDTSEAGEMSNGEFDGVLEFGHCRSVAPQTQGFNTDHIEQGAKRRVSVQARPFRRAGFVPLPMSFEQHMSNNCWS